MPSDYVVQISKVGRILLIPMLQETAARIPDVSYAYYQAIWLHHNTWIHPRKPLSGPERWERTIAYWRQSTTRSSSTTQEKSMSYWDTNRWYQSEPYPGPLIWLRRVTSRRCSLAWLHDIKIWIGSFSHVLDNSSLLWKRSSSFRYMYVGQHLPTFDLGMLYPLELQDADGQTVVELFVRWWSDQLRVVTLLMRYYPCEPECYCGDDDVKERDFQIRRICLVKTRGLCFVQIVFNFNFIILLLHQILRTSIRASVGRLTDLSIFFLSLMNPRHALHSGQSSIFSKCSLFLVQQKQNPNVGSLFG